MMCKLNKLNTTGNEKSIWKAHVLRECMLCVVLLLFVGLVLLCTVIKKLLVHLHEQLQGIVDQTVDSPEEEDKEEEEELEVIVNVNF